MKKQSLITSLAVLAMVLVASNVFAASAGDATDVGQDFFGTVQTMITGNFGFFLGLGITVLGIWTWVIKQQTGAGVTMIIGGVLITLSPSLFDSARNFVGGVVVGTGGTESNQLTPTTGINQ